ncbi:hypothetical protein Dsin_028356 [Dipteronia sinensis]|uniref:Pectinesterase inhibitor domain-containing protein n=1 Tax=Dipteronia sinensis TaxID=43782 RepID=A0AAD9ZR57_9ROSI|nr:hypothetical protein Dsin_028356 [Dipteronia sinensis]
MASRTVSSYVLSLVSVLYISAVLVTAANKPIAATASDASFIKISCTSTTYPAICADLSHSLRSVCELNQSRVLQVVRGKAWKVQELEIQRAKAIKDNLDEVSDTVDRLSKSVQELKQSGQPKGPDFEWHMSNVETWVSAALIDENTCSDGFAGNAFDGKVKASVRAQIVSVAHWLRILSMHLASSTSMSRT